MPIAGALLVCCLLRFVALDTAQKKEDPPDPKRVETVVSAIEAAFKGGAKEQRVAALEAGADVPDPAVVRAVEKGTKDADAAVRSTAIDALGRMRHPDALRALHNYYQSQRQKLKEDETLLPEVIRAIGRHGDDSSADLLAENLFEQRTHPAVQARIMALGNIRSVKGVQGLIEMLTKVGNRKADPYMGDVRLALMHITGADHGLASEAWIKWWQDNKSTFKVPKEVPKLPEDLQKKWDGYWETARKEPARETK